MFDLTSTHRLIIFGLVFLVLIAVLVWRERAQVRQHVNERIWQCCRYQGGANVYTPTPMTEEQAIHFASALGSILWVDRERGFIFYRPQGH